MSEKPKQIKEILSLSTETLSLKLYEQMKNDLKPLILAVAICLCIILSCIGSTLGIIYCSNILAMNIHKKGVRMYVYIISGFTALPFLLSTLIVFISGNSIHKDISFYQALAFSGRLIAFGFGNLVGGYAMGIIAFSTVKMVIKDASQRLRLIMSYAFLEMISVLAFILVLLALPVVEKK